MPPGILVLMEGKHPTDFTYLDTLSPINPSCPKPWPWSSWRRNAYATIQTESCGAAEVKGL